MIAMGSASSDWQVLSLRSEWKPLTSGTFMVGVGAGMLGWSLAQYLERPYRSCVASR